MGLKKNIKNIICLVAVILFTMLIPNVSSAKIYTVDEVKQGKSIGRNLRLNINDLRSRNDIYCVQWRSTLNSETVTYKVVKYVKIKGNKATDNSGNTSETHKANGRLAFILANAKNYGGIKDPDEYVSTYAPQQAIWATMNSWFNKVGTELGNFNYAWDGNSEWSPKEDALSDEAIKLRTAANNYAENVGNITDVNIENKTDSSAVKVSKQEVNGVKYIRVGPFKYKFPSKITSLEVKDENGNNINNVKVGKYYNNEQKLISIDKITSDKNFYVYLPLNTDINKITKISGKITVPKEIYTAQLWFIQCTEHQNLMIVNPGTDTIEEDFNFSTDYDIPVWTKLSIEKIDEENNTIKLPNVKFVLYNNDIGKYVKLDNNKFSSYVDRKEASEIQTDANGETPQVELKLGQYIAIETENPNTGYEKYPNETITINLNSNKHKKIKKTNKKIYGKLGIQKVDEKNNAIHLKGVKFIIYNKDTSKYVSKNVNGEISYVDSREQATVYETNDDGIIEQDNLLIGNYLLYETENPNEGYEVTAQPYEYTVGSNFTTFQMITNKKVYINISGYVWVDKPDEVKQSVRNDLYRDNDSDAADIRKPGVAVRLRNTQGNVVRETTTNNNGEYVFDKIKAEDAENYYVEFVYDGLIYQNVDLHLDKANGSKASEANLRDEFNSRFARIDGKARDEVQAKDANGNNTYNIKYDLNSAERTASIKSSNCGIAANTKNAGYVLKSNPDVDEGNIKNVNLGLYERKQVDMAILQDLDQIKISVKGTNHIYKYNSRFDGGVPADDDWNVGVKFTTNKYNMTYLRPVYRADAEYQDENTDNNLKVYLSYKIMLKNQTSIYAKINSISDYYDSRYTFNGAGLGIDERGNITDNLETSSDSNIYEGQYRKVSINTNSTVKPNDNPQCVYVQFILSRENVLNLLNDEQHQKEPNLKNLAEITSYTSYTDESMSKYYAAVDKDSVIDNVVAGNNTTYEDDTDTAPNVGLTVANARQISGLIFEDSADENMLKTQNIRQGDGKFDASKENKIGGVKVELRNVDSNGNIGDIAKVYDDTLNDGQGGWTDAVLSTTSSNDGTYSFRGFVPGSYAVVYTWGDGTYSVESYKATVIEESRYNNEVGNKYFYKSLNGQALSHGIDNWQTRQDIDKQLNSHSGGENNGYNYSTTVETNKMTSYTPTMTFNIEYDDNDLNNVTFNSDKKQLTFEVKDIDFGIIKRPVQSISIEKRIAHITVKYTTGDVVIDADITDDGKLTGQTNYLTYMKSTISNGNFSRGFLKAELDSEILQNTSLEIKYKFVVTNNSEADYASQGFYNFGNGYYVSRGQAGETQRENDVVTIIPTKIIDYLDNKISYNAEAQDNSSWTLKNEEQLQGYVTEDVINSLKNSNTYEYYTESLKDTALKPARIKGNALVYDGNTANLYMTADKSLTPSEDININNQVEIVELNKKFGSRITCTPGNYIPFGSAHESDDSMSEEMIVTPSTGANKNYAIIGTVTFIALVVLGAGVYFIRKFNKKQ